MKYGSKEGDSISTIERLWRERDLILQSAGEGICSLDGDGIYQSVNPKAEELTGWPASEMIGRHHHQLLHHTRIDGSPYPWKECPHYRTLRDGIPRTVSGETVWRKDGSQFTAEFTLTPIRHEGRIIGMVEVFRDITERLLVEKQAEWSNRLSSLGRLAATVAHEFNNVLMGIQPHLEVVQRLVSDDQVAASLQQISASVERGRRISEEILRFTSPAPVGFTSVAIAEWMDSIRREMDALLGPGYRLEMNYLENLSVAIDPLQLQQVLANLILNARDAMPEGGTIRVTANPPSPRGDFPFGTVSHPENLVHVTVTDTGMGIPNELLANIFEPLFTTKPTGTGLGLAVTRQIVDKHGGAVLVESQPSEGTTFHIFLPVAVPRPVDESQSDPRPQVGPARILLVEDDEAVASGIRSMLELEGFRVETAGRGLDAAATAEQARPDVVIMDVGLPDISGVEAYSLIESLVPGTPVIFSTGHAEQAMLDPLRMLPSVRILQKPWHLSELLIALGELLARSRP